MKKTLGARLMSVDHADPVVDILLNEVVKLETLGCIVIHLTL